MAVAMLAVGVLVAASGLGHEPALAAHVGSGALALIASGAFAFAGFLRHAPAAGAEADGR
ncbi:MAG: hypothetical protein U0599_17625 [Vicinamibacteria bacterium]